jgi:hypothetical protein
MRFGHTCWCTVVSVKQPLGLRFTSSNESLTDVVFSSVLRELSLFMNVSTFLYGLRDRDIHSGRCFSR